VLEITYFFINCAELDFFYEYFVKNYLFLISDFIFKSLSITKNYLILLNDNPTDLYNYEIDLIGERKSGTRATNVAKLFFTICAKIDGSLVKTFDLLVDFF
jgi:hypothetical protein